MTIKDSQIMQTALTKLFPFALMFSLYVFSYGGVLPGGGFQAGVVIGTLVVIIEMALERKLYSDSAFERIEIAGVGLLMLLLASGLIISGYPFGGLYRFKGTADPFANIMIWALSFGIFLEVAGSMVLIFRGFLFWETEDQLYFIIPGIRQKSGAEADRTKKKRELAGITKAAAVLLGISLVLVIILVPPLETVPVSEAETVRETAQAYGIRNMVSAVYLGPRAADTFLEVLVVVLTVFGIKAVRGHA